MNIGGTSWECCRASCKGINDECLWVLHGSDVELHVGGGDQQELEQQGLSKLVGRDCSLSCWL